MIKIQSLKGISSDDIFLAFKEAFKDYEMQLNKNELETMLTRRGFNPELSFGAFDNGQLVSFTFNGVGKFSGEKMAYDTGTGTVETYRGQGLATKIFNYSIPFLKEAGINKYLLEVLQHNTKAVSVYQKIGFEVSREFSYFTERLEQIKLSSKAIKPDFQIKEIDLSEKETMASFWDFIPSWQNSFEAIERNPEDFSILGAFHNKKLVGYSIFETNSGDITQIAVSTDFRRKGIATALLNEQIKLNKHDSVKCINTETSCDSISLFLKSLGIEPKGKQFEMIKQL